MIEAEQFSNSGRNVDVETDLNSDFGGNSSSDRMNVLKELGDQKFALDQAAIVAATDAAGVIIYVNEKFCEISGYQRDELLGQTHSLLNSGYHSKEFYKNMWQTISSGKTWKGDLCNRRKDGRIYWVNTTIVPFLDGSGVPYQYLAIRQDITQLKEAQETILQQQAQLVTTSKLSAIGEMAAAITHEIYNPLGVILGRCEMLKNLISKGNFDPETLTRTVDSIEITGQRIEKIVKSMRALAHSGADEEPFSPVYVREILLDTMDLISQRLKNHGIRLSQAEFNPRIQIECRGYQITQVLVNLLSNAHDAILDLPEKWVRIEVLEENNHIIIRVIDSGKGISAAVKEKLFQPFFSTKRVQYGTGLGLSISRGILQKHNGELRLNETLPNTCFELYLPKVQPLANPNNNNCHRSSNKSK